MIKKIRSLDFFFGEGIISDRIINLKNKSDKSHPEKKTQQQWSDITFGLNRKSFSACATESIGQCMIDLHNQISNDWIKCELSIMVINWK